MFKRKRKKRVDMEWLPATDIHTEISELVSMLEFTHVDPKRIICFRSTGSSSRARARIWSMPKVWQLALNIEPHYVIEVLSEKFDHLSLDDRRRVLIHELMHIPKTFSGALAPHHGRYHKINSRTVEQLFNQYRNVTRDK
ncbi:metallopeptidase [Candidatus Microgenomates bacterium]|nr:MAG: metallopeptidase [Candidatus Microgenomates bacterium]